MGSKWTIEFLNDKVEKEFDQFPADIRAKVIHIATLIAEFGLPNIGEPYIKHIQNKLWEIRAKGKDGIGRSLYVTAISKRVVILRNFIKKTRKTPQKEIEIALQRAKEINDG